MKEKIFRYENRFSVFFYRLAETIVFAYRNNDNVCHFAVASCIKNLLVLISEYGETSEHIVDFFNGLSFRSKIFLKKFLDFCDLYQINQNQSSSAI